MCGRFTSLTPPEELAELFGAELGPTELLEIPERNDLEIQSRFLRNFNVAPSMAILVAARGSDGQRRLGRMTWGLVPNWAKERRGTGHVNARAETIADKPSFRPSLSQKRCLIPMDGYYEWRTVETDPQPASGKAPKRAVYVTRADRQPLVVAGLWSNWRSSEEVSLIRTCCVITTAANTALAQVHDRMPVVLEPEDWSVWLGDSAELVDDALRAALDLLIPSDNGVLTMIDVGLAVNSVRNNRADLIDPIAYP